MRVRLEDICQTTATFGSCLMRYFRLESKSKLQVAMIQSILNFNSRVT